MNRIQLWIFWSESDDDEQEAPAKTKVPAPAKKPTTSRAKKTAEPKEPKVPKPKKAPEAAKPKKAAGPKKQRKAISDSDDDDIFGGGSDADVFNVSDVEPKQRGGRTRKAVKYDFDSDDSS